MTQAFRCLTALTLLLASSAGAVRAEEKQGSPAPHAACCGQCCSTCACSGKCCAHETPDDSVEYVVTTKIVHASADGDCDEMTSPKVTVFEGQTANVVVYGEQTPKESRSFSMQIRVASLEKGYRLNLSVEDRLDCHDGIDGEHTQTDSMRTNCNVTLGKMKRLVLKKDADGSDRAWAEVTVTEITPEENAEDSALDCVGEVVDDLIDTVADVATSLFGDDAEVQQAEFTTPVGAAPRDYPVQAAAPCPACRQCVAVEAVKMTNVHIHIDAKNNRTRVEVRNGNECWKGSAKHSCIANGELVLSGDVREESSGGLPELTSERITIRLDKAVIDIGD
jgi:hypothetical protein